MKEVPSHGDALLEANSTFGVLAAEYAQIWPNKPQPRSLDEYGQLVQANGQAALCLSGGGIRSASFALGVIQGLSRKRLLTSFHYLSTVSGGGYIGGWLQRWIHEPGWSAQSVMEELRRSGQDPLSVGETGNGSRSAAALSQGGLEPKQIRALRENSNFITPRVGISSNDTWTAISISVRNIAVNWLLFAPLFLLVTMVPNVFANAVLWAGIGARANPFLVTVPFALSLVCAVIAASHTCRAMPSYRPSEFDVAGAGDGWLHGRIVKWLVAWALLGSIVLWADVQGSPVERIASTGKLRDLALMTDAEAWPSWLTSGLGFALISLVAALASLIVSGRRLPKGVGGSDRNYRAAFRKDLRVWIVSFTVAAMTIPLGCAIFKSIPPPFLEAWGLPLFATLAPLWLMGSQLMVAFVFAAFRRNSGGTVDSDADREWLARLSAVKIKQMMLWAMLAFTTLLLLPLIEVQETAGNLSLTTLVALISGSAAVLGGRGKSSGSTTASTSKSILRFLPLNGVILIATFLFVIALLTIFGAIEQGLAGGVASRIEPVITASAHGMNSLFRWHLPDKWLDSEFAAHLLVGTLLFVILLRLDKRIPVNRFSLNGLYRNRLARAFLGGAREKRKPDPFTGFDPSDNVDLSALNPRSAGGTVLYPVINVALNVTASNNLAWQERKAEPFILSPLYCGSGMLAPEEALAKESPFASAGSPDEGPAGVYVCSSRYGGSEPEMITRDKGISLATAMSISGAAASPNMGYHSSAATAFLMTLFNVRLGQWMPNPARAKTLGDKVYLSNPASSLRALLRELGGSTDDLGSDIYLSDGGHFENLGIYEMVRRRCRFIVVSDAGADPNCDFADLGNAVRKVKIDLGADIRFTKMRISSRGKPIQPQFAWALGDIIYGDGLSGRILYIKPSFYDHGLPIDVVSYAAGSETFPHETTGDQFFSESQFESYRKLGFTFTSEIGGDEGTDGLEAFFDGIAKLDGDYEGQEDAGFRTRMRRWLGV